MGMTSTGSLPGYATHSGMGSMVSTPSWGGGFLNGIGDMFKGMNLEDWGSIAGFGKDLFEMYGANKMLGLYEDKFKSDQDYASLTAYNSAVLTDEARANQAAQGMNMQDPGSGDWSHLSDPDPIRYSV